MSPTKQPSELGGLGRPVLCLSGNITWSKYTKFILLNKEYKSECPLFDSVEFSRLQTGQNRVRSLYLKSFFKQLNFM